ncbi:MAG TPA: SDR family oxidoreductase [Polyangiaceae bacterium]|nr:SDR family oxidoreductase [Polyangiaceae bacterium]
MTLSVVTGANRGIGLALCAELAKRGHHVVAACRSSSPELAKLGVEVVEGVDVATDAGIAALVKAVGNRSIDLLVNNAGILVWGDQLGALNVEGIRKQFEVNALAPLRLTDALRDRLPKGAKVALITSRMGSIDDNTSGARYGYRMSKAALNMAGKSLAVDLKPHGVAVAILHPGMVKTDMIGGNGQVEPADAAKGLLARIDDLTLATSGGFWHMNGERLPW